jgi:hypothetical protein
MALQIDLGAAAFLAGLDQFFNVLSDFGIKYEPSAFGREVFARTILQRTGGLADHYPRREYA